MRTALFPERNSHQRALGMKLAETMTAETVELNTVDKNIKLALVRTVTIL